LTELVDIGGQRGVCCCFVDLRGGRPDRLRGQTDGIALIAGIRALFTMQETPTADGWQVAQKGVAQRGFSL